MESNRQPQSIFVTGATGVLGKRVVKLLVEKGIKVIALSRSVKNDTLLKEFGAHPVSVDIFSSQAIEFASKGCDAIFHLATSIPQKSVPNKKDWELNDRLRIEATAAIIKAAVNNGITKIIIPSICNLYGDVKGANVNSIESIAPPTNSLLESAYRMENQIRNETKIDSIICRFGIYYSEDSYHTKQLVSDVKQRKMPLIRKGDFYMNFIHTQDAAEALVYHYLNFEKYKNKEINLTDFNPIKYKEVLHFLTRKLNSKKPHRLPNWLAKLFMGRDMFEYITASYSVSVDENRTLWKPKLMFRSEMSGIIQKFSK